MSSAINFIEVVNCLTWFTSGHVAQLIHKSTPAAEACSVAEFGSVLRSYEEKQRDTEEFKLIDLSV